MRIEEIKTLEDMAKFTDENNDTHEMMYGDNATYLRDRKTNKEVAKVVDPRSATLAMDALRRWCAKQV